MSERKDANAIEATARGIVNILGITNSPIRVLALVILARVAVSIAFMYFVTQATQFASTIIGVVMLASVSFLGREMLMQAKGSISGEKAEIEKLYPDFDKTDSKYDVPSLLVIWKWGALNDRNEHQLDQTKVTTIRSRINGDIPVRFIQRSVYDTDIQVDSKSDPVNADTFVGQHGRSSHQVTYLMNKGEQRLNVVSTKRKPVIGKQKYLSDEEHQGLKFLYKEKLKTPFHGFAGSAIEAPTYSFRMLLYFTAPHVPKDICLVAVDKDGKEARHEFRKKRDKEKDLWIVECNNLPTGYTVAAVWVWDKSLLKASES